MGILTWVLQFLLAIAFIGAGLMKLSTPKDRLVERMEWARGVTSRGIKVIGLVELLGGIGLVLPALTGILPWLTPLAAIGLALAMLLAIYTHIRLREVSQALPAAVLLLLLVITIVGLFSRS
ncbi:MAG: hypothetical protein RL205_200 [Actinomycetota bacterium]|jgi:uncharacterized membrane protein YphA (DoxX/SURF4 family)